MSDKILIEYEVEINGLKAQMKEVQESLKATEKVGEDSAKGISSEFKKAGESTKSLKTQLRELKAQLANATDPKEIERLAKAAGKLTDQLEDATDAAKVFASESKFEQVGNALGSVVSKLRNLDFKGAADQSKLLVSATKSITFSEALGGVKQLGTTLLNVGKSLLMNPIFLIGAAVTAIIANFDKLASSGGLVGKIFKGIGDVVGGVKDGFLSLTDAIGLTDTAANEAAENIQKYYIDLATQIEKQYGRIIKITKAAGDDTVMLERKKAIELAIINEKEYKAYRDNLIRQGKTLDDLSDEELSKLKEFGDKKADLLSENEALYRAKQKADNDKAIALQKELNEKQLQLAKELRDLRASIIEDDKERELAQLVNKYTDLSAGLEQGSDKLLLLEEKYRQERNAIIKKYDDAEKVLMDKNIEESKVSVKKKGDAILQAGRDMHKQQLTDKDAADAKEIATEEKKQQMLKTIRQDSFAFSSDLLSQFGQISANMAQQEIQDSEIKANRELEILKSQYESGLISRVEYEKKTKALDDKARKEQAEIRRKQFENEKNISLIKIAISTAQGIANALEGDPYTVAYRVAFAALTGAAQAAIVASQPTPKFAKGVVDLNGKGTKTSDEIPALLSRGESVITADATATDKELFKAFNKGKGQKYIYEVYVAPALKEQLKKHSLSKDSSFAQNIANSMMLNSGKLNDGNILESLKMNRRLEKENTEKLIRAIKLNNTNIRSIV